MTKPRIIAASLALALASCSGTTPTPSASYSTPPSEPVANWNKEIKKMVQRGASEEEISEYLAPYGLKYAEGYTYKAEDYFDLSRAEMNGCDEYVAEVIGGRQDADYDRTFCHDKEGKKWAFMICYFEADLKLSFHSLLDREEIEEAEFVAVFDYHSPDWVLESLTSK